MTQDPAFAQWAALFLEADGTAAAPSAAPYREDAAYAGLTPDAADLLRAVDAGGVPAFVTARLKIIAQENGINVAADWTPQAVIDALRLAAAIPGEQDPER